MVPLGKNDPKRHSLVLFSEDPAYTAMRDAFEFPILALFTKRAGKWSKERRSGPNGEGWTEGRGSGGEGAAEEGTPPAHFPQSAHSR